MQVYDVTSFLALHPGGGQLVVDAAAQACSCKPDVNTLQKDMICVYIYILIIYISLYIHCAHWIFSEFLCVHTSFRSNLCINRILLHSLREHMEKD